MTQILITAPRGFYFPGDRVDLSEAEATDLVAAGVAARILTAGVPSGEPTEVADDAPSPVAEAEPAPVVALDAAPGEAVS